MTLDLPEPGQRSGRVEHPSPERDLAAVEPRELTEREIERCARRAAETMAQWLRATWRRSPRTTPAAS